MIIPQYFSICRYLIPPSSTILWLLRIHYVGIHFTLLLYYFFIFINLVSTGFHDYVLKRKILLMLLLVKCVNI
jgi:hypothetical protein